MAAIKEEMELQTAFSTFHSARAGIRNSICPSPYVDMSREEQNCWESPWNKGSGRGGSSQGPYPQAIDCVFVYLVRRERGDHVSPDQSGLEEKYEAA